MRFIIINNNNLRAKKKCIFFVQWSKNSSHCATLLGYQLYVSRFCQKCKFKTTLSNKSEASWQQQRQRSSLCVAHPKTAPWLTTRDWMLKSKTFFFLNLLLKRPGTSLYTMSCSVLSDLEEWTAAHYAVISQLNQQPGKVTFQKQAKQLPP